MNNPISTILDWTGFGIQMVGFAVWIIRHCWWRACGWWAITGGMFLVSDVMDHDRWLAAWNSVWTAYYLYTWWNGGGGDKTKRRLKKLAKKFTPVRRTAPSYGMEATYEHHHPTTPAA